MKTKALHIKIDENDEHAIYKNITYYSVMNNNKRIENVSEYIRRLIKEDTLKYKEELKMKLAKSKEETDNKIINI